MKRTIASVLTALVMALAFMASSLMQPPHGGGGFQELFTLVTKS